MTKILNFQNGLSWSQYLHLKKIREKIVKFIGLPSKYFQLLVMNAKGVHTELLFCLWWLILCQSWEKIYSLVSFAFLKLFSVPVIYSKRWKSCCLLHTEHAEYLFFGTGRKGENTMTKTLTQKAGSMSHLLFALMKYIQLSYEDMVCDNSWKEGVDKGLASLISWADKELIAQMMKQCCWKTLPCDARKQWEKRRVQAGRNAKYPTSFSLECTVLMDLFLNASTWTECLSHL